MIIAVFTAFWFYRKSTPALTGWRRWLLFALRTVSFFVILIFLFNPILKFQRKKTTFPKLIFLNDVSESMWQEGSESSKIDVYNSLREEVRKKVLSLNYELFNFDFAAGLEGKFNSTDLIKML
jgi:hypothetical protein